MAFENSTLDATLSAAAGDDPALQRELKTAFAESVSRQLDLLRRSRCDGNWMMAALRMKAIAASFHADNLIELAQQAVESAPGEPTVMCNIQIFLDGMAEFAPD